MGEKKKSFLSDNIQIWMHNETEAQKTTEENQQDVPKEQKLKERYIKSEQPPMLEERALKRRTLFASPLQV